MKWTKEYNNEMREIVDKDEIMIIGTTKRIEDMIMIGKGMMMKEEGDMKAVEDVIMIQGVIVTEEQEIILKEIENRDHLEEEMTRKEEVKGDTILTIEEAEVQEAKGKIED